MKPSHGVSIFVRVGFALLLGGAIAARSLLAEGLTMYTFSPPYQEQLVGINDSGEILGTGKSGSFVYNSADRVVIPFPARQVLAINNQGQLLFEGGIYDYKGNSGFRSIADLWKAREASGRSVAAGTIFPANLTGFNDGGQLVGEAYAPAIGKFGIYSTALASAPGAKSGPPALGDFVAILIPGHPKVHPTAINNRGQIVGTFGQLSAEAFLYDIASGTAKTFAVPESMWTEPRAINDAGLIVGIYQKKGGRTDGFLYDGTHFTTIVGFVAQSTQGSGNFAHLAYGLNQHGDIAGPMGGNRLSFIAMAGGRPPPLLSGFRPRPDNYERANPRTRLTGAVAPGSAAPATTSPREKDPNFVDPQNGFYKTSDKMEGQIIGWGYDPTSRVPDPASVEFLDGNDNAYLGFNDLGSWFYGRVDGWVYVYNRKEHWVHAITGYADEIPTSLANSTNDFVMLHRNAAKAATDTQVMAPGTPRPSSPAASASVPGAVGPRSAVQAPAPSTEASHLIRGREVTVANGSITFTIQDSASADNGKTVTYRVARFNPGVALTNPNLPKPANPDAGVWIGADPNDANKMVTFTVKDDRTLTGQPATGVQAAILQRIMAQSQK